MESKSLLKEHLYQLEERLLQPKSVLLQKK